MTRKYGTGQGSSLGPNVKCVTMYTEIEENVMPQDICQNTGLQINGGPGSLSHDFKI